MRQRKFGLMLLVVLAGCGGLLVPDDERPGVILFYNEPVTAEHPDTAQVGESFEISVWTYGGGCVSKGDTEVEVDGLRVDLRPFDVHSGASICTGDVVVFDHRATVSIEEPGEAVLRIHGLEQPADTAVTVERTVVVVEP